LSLARTPCGGDAATSVSCDGTIVAHDGSRQRSSALPRRSAGVPRLLFRAAHAHRRQARHTNTFPAARCARREPRTVRRRVASIANWAWTRRPR
jgi:hypothetical protein